MLSQITNIHHHKLPPVGAIGHIVGLHAFDPKEKFQVTAYPLNDNVSPWSMRIHTVFVMSLKYPKTPHRRISGFWFRDQEGA